MQALTLLNDPTFVEAARALATQALQSESDPIEYAFLHTLSRAPTPHEKTTLTLLHEQSLTTFAAKPKAAEEFVGVGITPAPKNIPLAELAAMTQVARALLNLHETHTRL